MDHVNSKNAGSAICNFNMSSLRLGLKLLSIILYVYSECGKLPLETCLLYYYINNVIYSRQATALIFRKERYERCFWVQYKCKKYYCLESNGEHDETEYTL